VRDVRRVGARAPALDYGAGMSANLVELARRRGAAGAPTAVELLAAAVARAQRSGHREISLSVMPDNPARELYLQAGFRRVTTVDGSWTMALPLRREVLD